MSDPNQGGGARRGAARILDRGYVRYGGPRRGRSGAVRSLIKHTMLHALGLRRSGWAKVLPFFSIALAYLPAIAFVGITSLARDRSRGAVQMRSLLPTYAEYYGFVWAAILVFVAFVAPEVLCGDRRNGMLGIYLASPLNRTSYLLGKAAGVAAILGLVTVGPPLLLLLANTLNDSGPDGFGAFLLTLVRVLVSGLAITALSTAVSFGVASLTTRRAFASIGVIFVLLGAWSITELLIGAAGMSRSLFLLDVWFVPFELVFRIYSQPAHVMSSAATVRTPALVAALVAWITAFSATAWFRYQRLVVTK